MKYMQNISPQNITFVVWEHFHEERQSESLCEELLGKKCFFSYRWSLTFRISIKPVSIQPSKCCLECVDSICTAYLQRLTFIAPSLPVLSEIKVSFSVWSVSLLRTLLCERGTSALGLFLDIILPLFSTLPACLLDRNPVDGKQEGEAGGPAAIISRHRRLSDAHNKVTWLRGPRAFSGATLNPLSDLYVWSLCPVE